MVKVCRTFSWQLDALNRQLSENRWQPQWFHFDIAYHSERTRFSETMRRARSPVTPVSGVEGRSSSAWDFLAFSYSSCNQISHLNPRSTIVENKHCLTTKAYLRGHHNLMQAITEELQLLLSSFFGSPHLHGDFMPIKTAQKPCSDF